MAWKRIPNLQEAILDYESMAHKGSNQQAEVKDQTTIEPKSKQAKAIAALQPLLFII